MSKFCKDCVHYYFIPYALSDDDGHRCRHWKWESIDLVTGETVLEKKLCRDLRELGGECGEEGKLWSAKYQEDYDQRE